MSHTVESCPLTKLNGGLFRLHSADEDTVSWLTSYYGSWNAYEKKTTPHPGLSKRRRHRSSHHCLICHCIRMQQFSKSSEMLTISCSHKIHDDNSNGSRVAAVTKKQADTHTHPQTDITANIQSSLCYHCLHYNNAECSSTFTNTVRKHIFLCKNQQLFLIIFYPRSNGMRRTLSSRIVLRRFLTGISATSYTKYACTVLRLPS